MIVAIGGRRTFSVPSAHCFDLPETMGYNGSEVVLGGEPGLPCTRNAHMRD